jgi:hypothetical protein
MPKIVVTNCVHPDVLTYLAPHAELAVNRNISPWTRAEIIERAHHADALLAFMTDSIDDAFLAAHPVATGGAVGARDASGEYSEAEAEAVAAHLKDLGYIE